MCLRIICVLVMLASSVGTDVTLKLNIVSVILGGNAAYKYGISAPAYDIAFDDAKTVFPALFDSTVRESVFHIGQSKTCDDEVELLYGAIGEIFQLLSRLGSSTIVQTPACTEMAVVLGDLTREMGIPLIISVAGGAGLLNKERFPYVLGFGPVDHAALGDAAVAMLDMYHWTTVSVLCGTRSQLAKPFDVTTCQTLRQRLRQTTYKYTVNEIEFDPDKVDEYEPILQEVQLQSRIVFLFVELAFLRPIMLAASTRNMTQNGDYVFLSAQSSIFPSQLRRPWGRNDSNDPDTLNALQPLVIYTNEAPDWTRYADAVRRITARAASHYSTNIPSNFVNALTMAAYDGFLILADVLRSLDASARDLLSRHADSIIPFFFNRTFALQSRSVYLDAFAHRRVNVQFLRLNNVSRNYEPGWLFDVASGTLTKQSVLTDSWVSKTGPPKDRPVCGFRHELCHDVRETEGAAIAKAVGFAALSLCLGGLMAFGCIKRRGLLTTIGTNLWLDSSPLKILTEQSFAYSFQFTLNTFSHTHIFKLAHVDHCIE